MPSDLPARDERGRTHALLRRTALAANAIAAAIGVLGLVGWMADSAVLRTFGADFPQIQIGSALVLVCGAAALELARRGRMRPALVLAAAVAGFAGASLAPHATGGALGSAHLMSVPSALAALGLAAGIALHVSRSAFADAVTEVVAALLAAIAFIAIVGMTFRVLLFYSAAPLLGLSLPAAIAYLLLAWSLIAGRPDRWLAALLSDQRPGAVVARWLLPAALLVPLALGWLRLLAERVGIVDGPLGAGLLALLLTCVLGALTLWITTALDRLDASRRRAEADAGTARERLEVVLASISDGVIATDRDGRVRFLNPAAEAFTGRSGAEALGRPLAGLLELVDERTGAPAEPLLARALAERATVVAGGEPAVRARDGSLRAVELVAAPLRDEQGAAAGGVLVLRDAAVRRKGERAMRAAYAELDRRVVERTRLLAAITASTPDLIYALDLEGRVLLANPAWLRARGVAETAALGLRLDELAGETGAAGRSGADERRVIESGEASVVEEVIVQDGQPRTYLTTKAPLRDEAGRIVGLIGVATDITHRKRAERELEALFAAEQRLRADAERANRAKDEFLAIVSHELRSPLNALRGWSSLLASGRPLEPAVVERATAAIKRSVEHQARLIDDLLDTARIMSGKLTLERRPLDLRDVVNAALETARPLAAAKHVALRVVCDPAIPVRGDSGRLLQVATNLLSNAVKFTPEHGAIEVEARIVGERATLAVRDNGIGIAPEFLPHVFDRFSQADTSTTRRAGGLGIGLALVRHLVALHGGTVRGESAGTGRGASFTVELPAAPEAADSARAVEGEGPARAAALAGLTVFVIDDDPDARETLAFALRGTGAAVEVFASGPDLAARVADSLASGAGPDVLLLDLAMPEEDGFAVLARVRAAERAVGTGRDHPIAAIAVSAFTEFDRERLARAGFSTLVAKPVDGDRLVRAISSVLEDERTALQSPAGAATAAHRSYG